jgi:hypothetical protein
MTKNHKGFLASYATNLNWITILCIYWERWGKTLHITLDISVVDVGREAHILGVGVDLLS